MRQRVGPRVARLAVGLGSMEGVRLGGLGTGFGRTLRVLEGVGLEPGSGRVSRVVGLGLGPEPVEGV